MDSAFEVHILNETGIANAKAVAEIFDNALGTLSAYCPPGREWSIVRTKLEEASFFAKKAMASNPRFQK